MRHDDDGQHELTGRAQLGEAVGAEHGDGALGEVHDTGCLVLADHAEGEQRDDRSATEAEQREKENRAHRRVPSAEVDLAGPVIPLVRQVGELTVLELEHPSTTHACAGRRAAGNTLIGEANLMIDSVGGDDTITATGDDNYLAGETDNLMYNSQGGDDKITATGDNNHLYLVMIGIWTLIPKCRLFPEVGMIQ